MPDLLLLGIYLYIGITSLCLYNTSRNRKNQAGILYKSNKFLLYNMINLCSLTNSELTYRTACDMINMIGRSTDCLFLLYRSFQFQSSTR